MEGNSLQERYQISGELTKKKLMKFLPFMIMTNLSNLLLVSVDGLVVGNFEGMDALSSVNVFYPIITVIGVLSAFISNGIATSLSVSMGESDQKTLLRLKDASNKIMIVFAVLIGLVQIPITYILIRSYGLSDQMYTLTWQYAIGVLISMPFGLVSSIGVCQLQIVGKMKILMVLAVIEGGVNLVMDLLFVGALKMGIAGAGYGTAIANVVRATTTVVYLYKKTDIYKTNGAKAEGRDVKKILTVGLPECTFSAMMALQNYLIIKIVLFAFGESGGVIRGVCSFAYSVAFVIISGIQGSMRPLAGILSGAEDWKGLGILIRQCIHIMVVLVGAMTALTLIFPELLYSIHGAKTIPEYGVMSLRIFSVHFVIKGVDSIYRLYFANRGKSKFSSTLTLVGSMTLPLFAYGLCMLFPNVWMWLSYLLSEIIIFAVSALKYRRMRQEDNNVEDCLGELYMTVEPKDAIDASRRIRNYAGEKHVKKKLANITSLCMEEMVAYAAASQKNNDLNIQIVVRFFDDHSIFMMLDDGRCISLDADEGVQNLITNNYQLLKKVAKETKYQYLLDMNYTVFNLEDKKTAS